MQLACRHLFLQHRLTDGRETLVIDDVSAEFAPGQAVLITGSNGAGKSTLLNLLAGFLRPSAGEVLADGAAISRWRGPHRDRFRRRVGFIFQGAHLLSGISTVENVILPLIPRGDALGTMQKRADSALNALGISHLAAVSASSLSGGEAQRACFARALAGDPELVLADEPTSLQDPDGVRLMVRLFRAWKAKGRTVVITGHDPRLAGETGLIDRCYRMERGRLGAAG